MDTDGKPDLHKPGGPKLLLRAKTERALGFAFEVLNELGHGLNEELGEPQSV
jgi:hypothetical protein